MVISVGNSYVYFIVLVIYQIMDLELGSLLFIVYQFYFSKAIRRIKDGHYVKARYDGKKLWGMG